MKLKLNLLSKAICLSLLALCFLFASCGDPEDPKDPGNNNGTPGEEPYYNPNAGKSRDLTFSHGSGLHSAPFSLTITTIVPESTIYYTTDGSIPSPDKVGIPNAATFLYSAPISVTNRNSQANVLSSHHEEMYGVAGDRGDNMPRPNPETLSAEQVPKATIIRAIAVDARGRSSAVVTYTYFIGNNLAGYGNTRIVSLVSDPDGLVSEETGIMVRGDSSNRWAGPTFYNFQKKGDEMERAAYLEIFDENNKSLRLSTGVGIRVRGGWSRATGQKSFTVYFKEQYGIKNLSRTEYDLIPGAVKADGKTRVDTFKGFMLRNGANDAEYTKFYDVFLQDLLKDRSYATQAAVPCIVYLNGEYWGPYNFQERYSDNHTGYKYGVKNENVISYDNGELDDGNAGEETLWPNLANSVINGTKSYADFCNEVDIDNFIDYWAAEIYIYNEDWPHNNYRIWRTRDEEPGNPYGDTKWRYQMFDTEFALGLYSGGNTTGQANMDAFKKILEGEHFNSNEGLNNRLFKKLLGEKDFCERLVNTIMDIYNVNFHPDNYTTKFNNYVSTYRPLMGNSNTTGTYFNRWGGNDGDFQVRVNNALNYLSEIRTKMVNNYLTTYFNGSYSGVNSSFHIGTAHDVTFNTTLSGTTIKVNTITVPLGRVCKYYSGNPITITVSPPSSSYDFDGFDAIGCDVASSSDPLKYTVTITGTANITAKYKPKGVTVVEPTSISLNPNNIALKIGKTETATINVNWTPSNTTYKTIKSWTSSNPDVATVDGNGKVTAVSVDGGTTTITAKTLNDKEATCTVTVTGVVVLLDLAKKLSTLDTGVIGWSDWDTEFDGLPISPAGNIEAYTDEGGTQHPVTVKLEVIDDNGVNKLQVTEYPKWGSGINVDGVDVFYAGDRIEIKGTFLNGPDDDFNIGLLLQMGLGRWLGDYDGYGNQVLDYWKPLWDMWSNTRTDFERTIILTADQASYMNDNIAELDGRAFQFKLNGDNSFPDYSNNGIGKYNIEQFKIYRLPN